MTCQGQLIDYKIAGSKDGNYIVTINGKQVSTFKEISNTPSSRTLEISFGGGDRTIEITDPNGAGPSECC